MDDKKWKGRVCLYLSVLTVLLASCTPRVPVEQNPRPAKEKKPPAEEAVQDAETVEPVEGEAQPVPAPEDAVPLPGTREQDEGGGRVQRLSGADSLLELAQYVNDGGDCAAAIWTLDSDVDLSGVDWTPIGQGETPFTGVFRGDGHRITGLEIKRAGGEGVGLFGRIDSGAEISGLHVEGTVMGERSVGGLAGMGSGKISRCSFKGTVHGISLEVGGLIGTTAQNAEISECWADAVVTGESEVGGLIGAATMGDRISNCYAWGKVVGQTAADNQSATGIAPEENLGDGRSINHIGGFAGLITEASLENCYTNSVILAYGPAKNLGAFCGMQSGSDTGCFYNNAENAHWRAGFSTAGHPLNAKPCSYQELRSRSTFAVWDFDGVWEMGETSKLPELRGAPRTQ